MNKFPVRAVILSFAVGASVSLVSAQEKVDQNTTQQLKKVDPVPPATGRNLPEQAGTQEPSTKGKGHESSAEVFINGVLTARGAATDGETAPAKYSARNAAIDKLAIVSFRLQRLSDVQKTEIYQQLRNGQGGLALSPPYATVGAEIPSDIALQVLKPVPKGLETSFPELRGTTYFSEGPNVLLVDANNVVVGVLSAR